MTRFSEALKRPVMTTAGARSVGSVSGFVVDPVSRRLLALRLAKTPGSGDIVLWEDLTAFGPDAVTLPTDAPVSEARGRVAELGGKDAELVGKRMLTDAGAELGTVDDVDFDPGTGSISYLMSADDRIAGDRLIGCGSYAVVVRAV